MTAGVAQASMAAGFAPAGYRSAQADHSSNGFSEALGPHHAGSNVHHRQHRDAKDKGISVHDALAAAEAEEGASAGTETNGDDGDALSALDQAVSDEVGSDRGADGEEAGVPAQIKAEQTISAWMAMAPITRRGSAEAGQHARNAGGPESAGSDRKSAAHRAVRAGTTGEQASETLAKEQLAPANAEGLAESTGRARTPNLGEKAVGDPAADKTLASTIGALPNKLKPQAVDTSGAGRHVGSSDTGVEKSLSAAVALAGSRKPTADGSRSGGNSAADSFASSKRAAEARRGGQQSATGPISVLSQQAAPAPAAPALTANAAAIVSALGADQDVRAAASGSAVHSASAFKSAQPMRTLKIQLHPAELGVVTAKLKSAGDHLTVELQVDNHEAYRRLSADTDAIASSLRSLGYDIDRITIQQPQAANGGATSSDAGSLSRDASSFQSGNSSNSGERSGGQASAEGASGQGASGWGDRGGTERSEQAYQRSSGDGLYI
ncbi:flagellar hook-length control protein FliK [Mesorhizobium sp. BAC0120]|uniref:flagellar hook-length control protein FliK n=1 Tax=Mesorhizobium sp. BAC0120 TaxID=3090670 RepID=UPI00298C0B47|nr:flagellar hook-length control protein FliK [Mesorhizobium sp. BAC0120]MDW6024430.1 flagellar hook-length control protein FliK [Mesorhizobium sp. BAC0120]